MRFSLLQSKTAPCSYPLSPVQLIGSPADKGRLTDPAAERDEERDAIIISFTLPLLHPTPTPHKNQPTMRSKSKL
jgi:hypothetical protein